MVDLVIRNGEVVDGTGAPRRRADIAVDGGRVVGVGAVSDRGDREVDAAGRVVTPGFVDVHTHYDAQVFWDPTLGPSPLHGVTSVFSGNCGFSIAPLLDREADYLMTMLARVEGMPLAALEAGVPWNWDSTAAYLNAIPQLSVNAGFMVGHSALRRVVMGNDGTSRAAIGEEVEQMQHMLREGLAAGAVGFSSSWAETHNDATGAMVPSRFATLDELVALSSVCREFPGTSLEFIPTVRDFGEEHYDAMTRMSVAAGRPLNWNLLAVNAKNGAAVEQRLAGGDYARERGGRVVALTIPEAPRPRLSFLGGFVLDALDGWAQPMALPPKEKLELLADPSRRRDLAAAADGTAGLIRNIARWQIHEIIETFTPETKRFEGRTVGDIAAEQGKEPFDALCDIVVTDELRTAFSTPSVGNGKDDWAARVAVWRDKRALIGASDAGAHLDLLATFNYTTTVLAKPVREHEVLSLEEAVHLMTEVPAQLYGMVDRGVIRNGAHADLVVLDPDTVGPEPVRTVDDMPTGASRVYGGATGIDSVLVAGEEIVAGGVLTDARPGRVLRSGTDTR
ncbi:MAG TPA: amidohydrolase family protein [Acidimicrobiia bacterium]